MQKHCYFEHFFKFRTQIGPKGTLIVTLQKVRKLVDDVHEVEFDEEREVERSRRAAAAEGDAAGAEWLLEEREGAGEASEILTSILGGG